METIENKPQLQEQPKVERLDSVIDAAVVQEVVGLETEIKEAEQQLGVPPESATDNVAEIVGAESPPE